MQHFFIQKLFVSVCCKNMSESLKQLLQLYARLFFIQHLHI